MQIKRKLGLAGVTAYQKKQAEAVHKLIKKFLDKNFVQYRCMWVAGAAASQFIATSKRERVRMFVMGSHGPGLLIRMLLGSVTERVLADSKIPTLLVK